jgi:crooked neck
VFELSTRSTSRHATIFSSLYSGSIDAHARLPQFDPTNSAAWIKYAELETQLADYNRARGIFELGVSRTPLSMPELLWKAYIDYEVEEGERARARALYERLAAASGHWKVWVAYAMFEAQPIQLPRDEREDDDDDGDEGDEEREPKMVEGDLELARQVFQKGYKDLKSKGLKNEVSGSDPPFLVKEEKESWCLISGSSGWQRVALLQVWKSFEEQRGTADDIAKVDGMMPVQGKRRYADEETGQVVEGTHIHASL